jgi:dTDP-L-rhamnose 4-epimerase
LTKLTVITGGVGFIGTALARRMISLGHQVRIIDNFSPQIHATQSLPDDLTGHVELLIGDVRDRVLLREALADAQNIVHLAAETGTGQSMYQIEHYFSVNVGGTALLLDILQNDSPTNQLKNLVVASSRAIYGEGAYLCPEHNLVFPRPRTQARMAKGFFEPVCPICSASCTLAPTPENAQCLPMSHYALTKQVQEQAVLLYAQTAGINGFALRYQNVYGPGQSLQNPYTGILAVFSNLARQNNSIEIYEDGLESRDFVFIDDVIEATARAVNFGGDYVGPINVGTGVGITVGYVAEKVRSFFESESSITVNGAFRMGDIRHNIAATDVAVSILGFRAQTAFDEGLIQFLQWAETQKLQGKAAYDQSVNELKGHGLLRMSETS